MEPCSVSTEDLLVIQLYRAAESELPLRFKGGTQIPIAAFIGTGGKMRCHSSSDTLLPTSICFLVKFENVTLLNFY